MLQVTLNVIEDLVAAIQGCITKISLGNSTIYPRNIDLQELREGLLIWRAVSSGCMVSGGTITMLTGCVWLLSGNGVTFTGANFEGMHRTGTFNLQYNTIESYHLIENFFYLVLWAICCFPKPPSETSDIVTVWAC